MSKSASEHGIRLGAALAMSIVGRCRRGEANPLSPGTRELLVTWAAERMPLPLVQRVRFDPLRGMFRPARQPALSGEAVPFERLRETLGTLAPDHSVIAFDVFDTLLRRAVDPEWVKTVVARQLTEELRLALGASAPAPPEVRSRRVSVERELARERLARGDDDEADHASIAERWVSTWVPPGERRAALVSTVAGCELRAELAAVLPSPGAAELLRWLRDGLGRRLVFVSDMYLSSESVRMLLAAHGLGSYFEAGYVSSEHCRRKATGRLFERVLEIEGIEPRELLVVGDDAVSDGEAPRRLGIRSVLVGDARERRRRARAAVVRWAVERNSFWAAHLVDDAVASELGTDEDTDREQYLGRVVAPALCSFALHVLEQCERMEVDRVYFLAREGLIIQRLCRMLSRGAQRLPPDRYLLVSRASTFLPSLRQLSIAALEPVRAQYERQSLRELLRTLALPDEPFLDIAARCGISDPERPLTWAGAASALDRFTAEAEVKAAFERERDRAHLLLRSYLERQRFFDGGRVAIVDVGWNGSMQDNLIRAFGHSRGFPEIHGMYLGYRERPGSAGVISSKCGFLADSRRGAPDDVDLFRNAALFEIATTSGHGTTVAYRPGRRDGSGAVPVLAQHPVERENFERFFSKTQQVVYAYARALAHLRAAVPFRSDELRPGVMNALMRYVRYPDYREAADVLRYSHVESFGVDEVTTFGLRAEAGTRHSLAAMRARFRSNRWREAAVARTRVPLASLIYDAWWTLRNPPPRPPPSADAEQSPMAASTGPASNGEPETRSR